MANKQPVNIGPDRQLFVDDFWIAESNDTTRVLHEPTRREPVIEKDYPWEQGFVGGATVAYDGDKYRMWYSCDDASVIGVPFANYHKRAYAESDDGISWTKPLLGLAEYEGSKENNLLATDMMINQGVAGLDKNPDAREEERFKAFNVVPTKAKAPKDPINPTWRETLEQKWSRGGAIVALASPDGINWRQMFEEPILSEWPFDSKNLFFWDEWTGQYRGYARGIANNDPNVDPATVDSQVGHEFVGGVRWVRWTTSPDFRTWTPLQDINTGDTPFEHLYSNECWPYDRAPRTYLMFPSRYVAHRRPDPDWYDGPGVNDVVLMSSRDGVNFDRSFMETFIRPGLDTRNWHERGIFFEHGIFQTSPTELTMYVNENIKTPGVHIRRYTIRPDGFVSVNAGYGGGEFTTKPFTFEGHELELNYSTSAVGSVKVEIQDETGKPLPGFTLNDCPEMFADLIEGQVTWETGGDVSRLAGKPVRLRFALMDADLYAFKFNR